MHSINRNSRPSDRRDSAISSLATNWAGPIAMAAGLLVCFLAIAIPAKPAHAVSLTFTVTTAIDENGACDASCSFREAITAANANPGQDTINFNLVPAAPWVFTPGSQLPAITDGVTINGFCAGCESSANTAATSQPVDAVYSVILNGAAAGAGASGLNIASTAPVTVRGLVINGWSSVGIRVSSDGDHVIAGNFIGTNVTGTAGVANSYGITISESGVTIGGSNPADRNVISGNTNTGVYACDPDADDLTIRGNFIGPAASGTAALINGDKGIVVCGGTGITIGGSLAAGSSNVISGNINDGIYADSVTDLDVQGNRIGTTRGGTAPLPNGGHGVNVFDSSNVDLGGFASGNTLSSNFGSGIFAESTTGLTIRNNTIGIAASGGTPLPNGDQGISIQSANSLTIVSNYIGDNVDHGILLEGEINSLFVRSNFIGVTFVGDAHGNGGSGIVIAATETTDVNLGDSTGGNIIVNNGQHGISVSGGTHTDFQIGNNQIGVDSATPKANADSGINIGAGTAGAIVIGQSGLNGGNTIRFNGDDGITVDPAVTAAVSIRYNNISDNGDSADDIPIDLGNDGLSPNDALDADGGANSTQNYPIFVDSFTTFFRIQLDSPGAGIHTIDLYEAICVDGQAHPIAHLASKNAIAGGSGLKVALFTNDTDLVAPGSFVTATATSAAGETSEVNPNCTPAVGAVVIFEFGGVPGFYPQSRTIERGTELLFVQRDDIDHTATSDDGVTPPFDSGIIDWFEPFAFTFDTVGLYTYHCDIHPGMTGTITVTGTNPDPHITNVTDSGLFQGVDATVVIEGTGFISSSLVEVNGVDLEWSFSGSNIQVTIPAFVLDSVGPATVRVSNPAPFAGNGFYQFVIDVDRPSADVDCDLDVDALDVLAILRNLAGFETGLLPEVCDVDPVNPAGDANLDGEEGLGDALFARLWVAGLVSFP